MEKIKKLISPTRKKILVVLILIILLGSIVLRLLTNNSQAPQFQTAQVEKGTLVDSISASGKVITANLVTITTGASGEVEKVYVKDGDKVTTGDKIAEIALDQAGQQKNASAWSSYLSAKNSVDSAGVALYTLRSAKDTAWKKFYDLAISSTYQTSDGSSREDQRNSSAEFQSLQADWLAGEGKYKNQQAVIDQAKASMNSTWLAYQATSSVISAPVSGTVSNIVLTEGMVLSLQSASSTDTFSSQRVAVIKNQSNPIIVLNLTEIDVSKVKVGQKATVTLDSLANKSSTFFSRSIDSREKNNDANPRGKSSILRTQTEGSRGFEKVLDKTFTGKVTTVDRIGSISNNVVNYPATLQLDTDSAEILPNMTVSVSIIVDTKSDVLIIPSSAIQTQAGESTVRVLKNGKEEQISVQTGISSDTQTEIVSGLSEGDEVIAGTVANTATQPQARSVFSTGFGSGGFRPGGFGNSQQRR